MILASNSFDTFGRCLLRIELLLMKIDLQSSNKIVVTWIGN